MHNRGYPARLARGGLPKKNPMTFAEILALEDPNQDKIYLFREGKFLKAYEHSAYLFHRNIQAFKLSYRYIKTVNRNVVSLGFPEAVRGKWLHDFPVHEVNDKMLVCESPFRFDETEYYAWLELARVEANPGDRYTVHTSVIEDQPVFKTAYDLLIHVIDLSVHVSKPMWDPFAIQAKGKALQIAYQVSVLYDAPDRDRFIDEVQELCKELAFVMRVLKDKKQISLDSFALCSERIVSVSKQLDALRRKVKA